MQITVLGGTAAALPLIRALKDTLTADSDTLTVIANTSTDMTVHGLRACPDLDAVMTDGRAAAEGDEASTHTVTRELAAHGVDGLWFDLDDVEIATLVLRTRLLSLGYPLDEVTRAVGARWEPGLTLLPMSNDSVETHVILADDGTPRAIHVQEWLHTAPAARATPVRFAVAGLDIAKAAPGVLDALRTADVILLAPVDPTLYLEPMLSLPAMTETLLGTRALVLGCRPDPAVPAIPPGSPTAGDAVRAAWDRFEWHDSADPAELVSWALSHPGRKRATASLWDASGGQAARDA